MTFAAFRAPTRYSLHLFKPPELIANQLTE